MLAVAEVMLEVIALCFEDVVSLVLDLPACATPAGRTSNGLFAKVEAG